MDFLEDKPREAKVNNQQELMDFLNDSPKTTRISLTSPQRSQSEFPGYRRDDFSGSKVYRVGKAEKFHLALQEDWEKFQKLISSIEMSYLHHVFSIGTTDEVVVIYECELKYVDRKEHDANLPETDIPPNPDNTPSGKE